MRLRRRNGRRKLSPGSNMNLLNSDTEILFPVRVIPSLRDLRGAQWMELIDRLTNLPAENDEVVAFSLMMVRLGGCNACNADSFRAMRGCTHCARLTIRRFKNSDQDLIDLLKSAREEVREYLDKYQ